MKLWKLSGVFLFVTGVLHTGVALVIYGRSYEKILKEGLFNSLSDKPWSFGFLVSDDWRVASTNRTDSILLHQAGTTTCSVVFRIYVAYFQHGGLRYSPRFGFLAVPASGTYYHYGKKKL